MEKQRKHEYTKTAGGALVEQLNGDTQVNRGRLTREFPGETPLKLFLPTVVLNNIVAAVGSRMFSPADAARDCGYGSTSALFLCNSIKYFVFSQ